MRSVFTVLLVGVAVPASSGGADPSAVTLYHTDPNHLWNRVHAALLVRSGPDGKAYGHDRLEPLLWKESDYLSKGAAAGRALAVLDEFLRVRGEKLIDDPVKRAMLQRDLWLVFDVVRGRDTGTDRGSLCESLAKVIRRLALPVDRIVGLPDNYAAAVAAKRFADWFDPTRPEHPYLPPDLFAPDGPWVCVGRSDALPASAHHADTGTNPFTNSVFLIFLKVPGGREKAVDWLKRMAAYDKPVVLVDPADARRPVRATLPNPAVPPLPAGTEVALVRRMLLVDANRRVVAGPLTESVQVRVMRADGSVVGKDEMSLRPDRDFVRRAFDRQAFFAFQVRRAELFAGTAGGLRDASGDRDFKTGFAAHQWDAFGSTASSRPFPDRALAVESARQSCLACHTAPGVYGINFLHRTRSEGEKENFETATYPLAASSVVAVEKAVVEWKESRPAWKALRVLLPE